MPPSPDESTVLLQESLEGRTSRTSIEPNHHLINRVANSRLIDEEHVPGRVVANGNLASVLSPLLAYRLSISRKYVLTISPRSKSSSGRESTAYAWLLSFRNRHVELSRRSKGERLTGVINSDRLCREFRALSSIVSRAMESPFSSAKTHAMSTARRDVDCSISS